MRRFGAWLQAATQSSPLREPFFRLFYLGSICTALGYTTQTTIAAWLMATVTPSTLMVALVQTASTGPTLLFGLIAGSLADIAERKRLILLAQVVLVATVALLGVAALTQAAGPLLILALTFLVGCSFTFYLPAQQASISDCVPRKDLSAAVALSAVAFNAARAAGPALAGVLAAWLGPGIALVFTAAFFGPMLVLMTRSRQRDAALPGVPERLLNGVRSGLRFAWHSAPMRALLVRDASFCIFASAFWALLPVIAIEVLGLKAQGFGLLSAAFGIGAFIGAWSIPMLLKRVALNQLVLYGVLTWAFGVGTLAALGTFAVAMVGAVAAGAAWVWVLGGVSAGIQSTAPSWVRARAVSLHLVATQASLALGSVLWGLLASYIGIRTTVLCSVFGLVGLHYLTRRFRTDIGEEADVLPNMHAPELVVAVEPSPDDGPVLIQIEYRVAVPDQSAFLRAIAAVAPTRRRNGATSWRVFRDLEERELIIERYVVASWADYLRHRGRMTISDADVQTRARRFQMSGVPIRVSRLIGIESSSLI